MDVSGDWVKIRSKSGASSDKRSPLFPAGGKYVSVMLEEGV